MRRLVSLLLIFSLLLAQALPHSHAGSGADQPDDHASRPHIHFSLHGHSHSSHSHSSHSHSSHSHSSHSHSGHSHSGNSHSGDQKKANAHLDEQTANDASCLYGVHDHDDDAIYLAGSTLPLHRLSDNGNPTHFTSLSGNMAVRFCIQSTTESKAFTPPLRQQTLPIYLLVASLRL